MNWFWDNIHLKKEDRSGMFTFLGILFFLVLIKWYMVVHYTPPIQDYGSELAATMEFTFFDSPKPKKEKQFNSPSNSFEKPLKRKSHSKSKTPKKNAVSKKFLFDFDPNTTGLDSLLLIGINKYAANNIIKYRNKGGRFKQANDLQKVYGMDSVLMNEILPFVKVKQKRTIAILKKESKITKTYAKPKYVQKILDVNLADTTDFKSLRGIGSVYANRIVKFRNSLGGYFSIDQIGDVWGVSDSLFTAIKPFLKIDSITSDKKNINFLEKDELVKHPYIDWKKAKYIISYRNMHGDFNSMDEFEKLHGLDKEFIDTLKQYFVAQ